MSDNEALGLYIRMLKGEDVMIRGTSKEQALIAFKQVAKWAERGASLKVHGSHRFIGPKPVVGYTPDPGSLRVYA